MLDVTADTCGNGLVVKRVSGSNDLVAVYYDAANGWRPPIPIVSGGTAGAQHATAALSGTGEGMVVYRLGAGYHASVWSAP